jgi:MoaA/NifB/PqqE/SkfB family radical SAM enzyme
MNNNTFCVYPFIHISTERNGLYTCCGASLEYSKKNVRHDDVATAWNDEYFRQLRLDSVNGIQNSNCQTCWYHESQGVESRRQKVNQAFRDKVTLTSEKVNQQQGYVEELPMHVNIRVENICNLKCITCNHYHSSQHEKEIDQFKQQGVILPKWMQWVDDRIPIRIDSAISKKNTVATHLKDVLTKSSKLEIEGGEPLLASMTQEILTYCIDNNHTDVEIEIVSNLTSLTDNMLDTITKFSNLNIWISWDHLDPEKFRFIRYPADYSQFLSAFKKLSQHKHIKIGISFTASIFNIFEVPEILDHFENLAQQGILQEYIIFKPVFMPDYFSVNYLEADQRSSAKDLIKRFITKNKNYKIMERADIQNILNDMDTVLSTIPDNFTEVVKERTRMLELYDKTRNTDYKKLFPYIKPYF